MNIIDVQDKLKDFSEQQLIREMQMPSGTAPQFLVLSEIQRRKRMRDDFAKREAAQQQTVAQEAVSAAGVPDSGIAGMSEAMAPKSTMAQNAVGSNMAQAMRSGGLAQFGQELSGKVSEGVEPFLDEVEGMAQERFGVDMSGLSSAGLPEIAKIQPMYEIARPNPDMFLGRVPAFMQAGYRGPRPQIANHAALSRPMRGGKGGPRTFAYNEGGAVKMSRGGLFGAQGRPTEALLRALIAQESGGDPKARGSLDEVGISQIRPSTALMPGYGVSSMFPEIAAKIGEGKEYSTVGEAYLANKELIDAGLEDSERSTAFTSDYLTAMRGEFDDDARALAAYNVGPGAAADLENPAEFGYVTDVLGRMEGEPSMLAQLGDAVSSGLSAINPISTAQAQASGPVMTEVEEDTKVRDFEGRVIGDTSLGPSLRENPDPGSYQYDPETGEVIGDTMAPEERRLLNEAINMGRDFEMRYRDRDPDDLTGGALGSGAITGSTAGMSPDQIAEVQPVPASTDVNRASESETTVLQAGSKEDKITFPEQTTNVEGDTTTVEGDTTTFSPTTMVGGEAGTYDASGVSSEIQRLKDRLEKDRDSDKWLALAQAGLALMSSKEPTLLGAAGEAGLSGLTAFREAQERYQEGVIDLINAQAKLKGKSGSLTSDEALSTAVKLEAEARQLESNGLDPARANLLRAQAQRLFAIGGLPVGGGGNVPDLSAPAS